MAVRKKEIIYEQLKEGILSLKTKPDTVLKEEAVARAFNVSRTPAHDALLQLQQEGLLLHAKKVGYVVKPLSISDLKEIIQLRSVLEGYAARLTAENQDEKIFSKLEKINRKAKVYLEADDLGNFFKNSSEFHSVIYNGSKNKRLIALVDSLYDSFVRYRKILLRIPEMPEVQIMDHEKMLVSMIDGHGETVEKLVRDHIVYGGKILMEYIETERVEK